MTAYLALNLDDITIDLALVRRLPLELANYYLALPLGSEDGAVSVAMAHPENDTALVVLGDLLGAAVVPVRAPAVAVRKTLQRLQDGTPALKAEAHYWRTHAGRADAVRDAVEIFSTAQVPLLLLRGKAPPLRRALVALRGYASDSYILDWLAPLLREPGAQVTLLSLSQSGRGNDLMLPSQNGSQKRHLDECLSHPALGTANTLVKFRQGQPLRQLVEELEQDAYDLVAIPAEGYGHFVSNVLEAVEQQGLQEDSIFFVLKPPGAETSPNFLKAGRRKT